MIGQRIMTSDNLIEIAEAFSPTMTKVYLDPCNYTFSAPVKTLFNVTIKVDNMDDMKGWQVGMGFDDSIINITRWYEPTWDPNYVFYEKPTSPSPPPPNVVYSHKAPDEGWAGVYSAVSSPGGGFTGNGTLCILTFVITAVPPPDQTYSCSLNITNSDTAWFKVGEWSKRFYDTYANGYCELGAFHNIAITNVTPSETDLVKGYSVNITVIVENQGSFTETFNVTVYANTTVIATFKGITLARLNPTILTFNWNTTQMAFGKYTISAEASIVPEEINIADNTLIDGTISIRPSSKVYMVPSNYTFSKPVVGTLFNVTIKVDNMDDLASWQVIMGFDDSIINITRWYEPTWDPTYVFYGKTTLPVPPPPDVTYTYVPNEAAAGVGSALLPAPSRGSGFTGNGTLCILTFNITAVPLLVKVSSLNIISNQTVSTFWIKADENTTRPFDVYVDGYCNLGASHNIAITKITPFKTVLAQGNSVNMTVRVENQGGFTETFNVTVYANTTSIASQNVTLTSASSTTITFTWNTTGFAKGNYTIWAYASPVPDETDTADNTCNDVRVRVTIPGDVTGEGTCNMLDITIIIGKFMTSPPDPRYNPNADLNGDGTINMVDIQIAINNFMKTDP
jgi:hypothetical protein